MRCEFGTFDKSRGSVPSKDFGYKAWENMISRCYNPAFTRKHNYAGCTVSSEWIEFHDFNKWIMAQPGYGVEGFQLDKDLLVKGNRIYGPDTCALIPRQINQLLTNSRKTRGDLPVGVSIYKGLIKARTTMYGKTKYIGLYGTVEDAFLAYKAVKEAHIKTIANEWRGRISERAYLAMMNYTVEITD